ALDAPELTGEWEYKLAQMERGRLKREAFMREIALMTKEIVERIRKGAETGDVPGEYAKLKTPCPNCGGKVTETYRRYACKKCDFSISKHPGGRFFEIEEVELLLKDKQIGPLTGFRSRIGRPFAAVLKITPEHKLEFDFGNAPMGDDEGEPIDFSGHTALGPCPKCGANVYEQPMSYVCEKSVGPQRSCDFRSGKVILQQPIDVEQMKKLLENGRTDLLRGFVSNRTRRKFAAFLVRKPDGSTGFEFEPRAAKAPNGKGKEAAGAAEAAAPARETRAAKGTTKNAAAEPAAPPYAAAGTKTAPRAAVVAKFAGSAAAKAGGAPAASAVAAPGVAAKKATAKVAKPVSKTAAKAPTAKSAVAKAASAKTASAAARSAVAKAKAGKTASVKATGKTAARKGAGKSARR
ncbi:MAG TPA: topoisomerase C-terminal repeat-containing protein, partial [Burkholderiaceae bacterium]|nr:topoisomerase C-terminal repeat-containing protein [Burkholderiaceae bacterium]